ncbi:hypothetical protein CsSME_00021021 [Camellia sinensis var. sinensis]
MRPNVVIVIVHRRNFCLEWSSLLWYYALFAIPVVCYIIAFTLSGILFIWFNPSGQDCGLNVFFLVMTMILAFAFAVIALHPQVMETSVSLVVQCFHFLTLL